MNPRLRKLIGGVLLLVFVFVYVTAAIIVAGLLPDNRLVQLAYFVVVGLAWGLPILPLLSWMDKGFKKP
jgi:hypothetical protein